MPKTRDKSIRLEAIGCNADEKALAEHVIAMLGINRKVLQYATIKIATQGRIGIKIKAAALGLTVDQYRAYLEAQSVDSTLAERLLTAWATLTTTV